VGHPFSNLGLPPKETDSHWRKPPVGLVRVTQEGKQLILDWGAVPRSTDVPSHGAAKSVVRLG
jgi:hypothetical protein